MLLSTLAHAGLSVHRLVLVCADVCICAYEWLWSCGWYQCVSFYPLDRCIDHLAKLQQINVTAIFTAGVQLLCLQTNAWAERWRDELILSSCLSFKKLAELTLTYFEFVHEYCVNEIYCSAKSILIENNPCFTCGQCKFHFLEHLYCPFIYFPVSSLSSRRL